MKDKLRERVFSIAGYRYEWADVVTWARAQGMWEEFQEAVRLGLACARRLEEDEAAEIEGDRVEAAANEFRYARGLLSAEEMDAWLDRVGLSAEEWMASIERGLASEEWSDEAADILEAFPVSDEEVEAALWCEGLCSGQLGRFARELARSASIDARLREEDAALDAAIAPHVQEARALVAKAVADPVLGLDALMSAERLAHLAHLEAARHRFRAAVLTPQAIRDQIAIRYLDWIRFHGEVLSVSDEHVAREAAAAVREDGLPLAQVAALARESVEEIEFCLDDVEPALREPLLSAGKGDLIGPVAVGEEFRLVLVKDKVMPSDADPRIRRRAEEELLTRLLAREVDARVEWHVELSDTAP
jgi:hypothetical protein